MPPPPISSSDGAITPENILEAIKNAAAWLADVAEAVAESVLDFVDDNIATVGTAVSEAIKYALYLLNRALYAAYRSLREVLVLSANAAPFTDELIVSRSAFNTANLWQSMGNMPPGRYPVEEVPAERMYVWQHVFTLSASEHPHAIC